MLIPTKWGAFRGHALVERGERVRGIDDFATGKPENLAGVRGRVEFIEGDINDAARQR